MTLMKYLWQWLNEILNRCISYVVLIAVSPSDAKNHLPRPPPFGPWIDSRFHFDKAWDECCFFCQEMHLPCMTSHPIRNWHWHWLSLIDELMDFAWRYWYSWCPKSCTSWDALSMLSILNKLFISLSPCLGAALMCSSGDLSIVLSQATSWIHGETNICPAVLRCQGYVMTCACIHLCRGYWIIRSPKSSFKMSRILEQVQKLYFILISVSSFCCFWCKKQTMTGSYWKINNPWLYRQTALNLYKCSFDCCSRIEANSTHRRLAWPNAPNCTSFFSKILFCTKKNVHRCFFFFYPVSVPMDGNCG